MKSINDERLQDYFDSMLCSNPEKTAVKKHQHFETQKADTLSDTERLVVEKLEVKPDLVPEKRCKSVINDSEWKNIDVGNEFQVLFFELNNVTFAIPLTDLVGIHPIGQEMDTIAEKPAWFSGVIHRNEVPYDIVDTSLWMKLPSTTSALNYSHFIILANSVWGLSCEKLLGTDNINREQVKWRETKGTRPWLAGILKDKMCVLIHVKELIILLNQGLDIKGKG